jgi:GxxExxY protein
MVTEVCSYSLICLSTRHLFIHYHPFVRLPSAYPLPVRYPSVTHPLIRFLSAVHPLIRFPSAVNPLIRLTSVVYPLPIRCPSAYPLNIRYPSAYPISPMPLDPSIPHSDITYRIIGCAMRVHTRMGPGLRERHYQRALTAEMQKEGLLVYEEYPVEIYDGDEYVGWVSLDHFVENTVVVEDKAFPHMLTNEEVAQVITYLVATKQRVGLLLNFGRPRLEHQRILPPQAVTDWQTHARRYLRRDPPPADKNNKKRRDSG